MRFISRIDSGNTWDFPQDDALTAYLTASACALQEVNHLKLANKVAVITTTAAVALAPHKIRVVGIGPGTILTEMVASSFMNSVEAKRSILSRTPIGRCGDPKEIASVASFLASEDASYITGQTIYPDGGRLVLNYTVPVPEA